MEDLPRLSAWGTRRPSSFDVCKKLILTSTKKVLSENAVEIWLRRGAKGTAAVGKKQGNATDEEIVGGSDGSLPRATNENTFCACFPSTEDSEPFQSLEFRVTFIANVVAINCYVK